MARLKAFTLIELVVAMLLLGITVALAYGIIGYLASATDRWGRADRKVEELRVLHGVLVRDLDHCERTDLLDGTMTLSARGTTMATYTLSGTSLIRTTGGQSDTLLHDVLRAEHSWKGVLTKNGPVDLTLFTMAAEAGERTVSFRKHYDLSTLYTINTGHAHSRTEHRTP